MDGEIELEIGPGPTAGAYVVRVVRAAAGGEPVGTLSLDVADILGRRDQLEATILSSAVSARRTVPVVERPIREVGRQLFDALFTGPVYGTYRASLGVAHERGKRLRVVLRLAAPELAAVPWETLFDPETETYLCRQEPLVRHVPAPYTAEPLAVSRPLRILGLVASPRGLAPLDVEAEQEHLAEALAEPIAAGLVDLVWVPQASWSSVHSRLLSEEWHVLHFIGHGDYDLGTDEGLIALVGDDGRADLVEAGRLADLLGEADPTPRLVVLNSCSSGEAGLQDLFSSTAATLVRSGINAVAAMQFTISDTAAIAFARGFYTAIAHGRRVDEAARSGRISILGARGTLEWVTPVLYVRGQSTQLFTFTSEPTPPADVRSDPSSVVSTTAEPTQRARRRAELSALYVEARAELRVQHFDTALALFDDLLILDPGHASASELRANAARGKQLADAYAAALDAEDNRDWLEAARQYDDIVAVDPAYRDATVRRDACEQRQRTADLEAELRHHADSGHWQAVLDVDTELTALDPSRSDLDGLATRARATIDAAQRAASLELHYAQAHAAEEAGELATAARGYADVLAIDPEYRDAAARAAACEQPQRTEVAAPPAPQGLGSSPQDRELLRVVCFWPVAAVAWHPDGTRIAVGTGSAKVRLYSVSGTASKEYLAIKTGGFWSMVVDVAFSPDGQRLATAGNLQNSIRIWDATTGKRLLEVDHDQLVKSVRFSWDGTRLVTGGPNGGALVLDTATGTRLDQVLDASGVAVAAYSPDGRLATGRWDGSVQVFARTGWNVLEQARDQGVPGISFDPVGSRLAVSSNDGSVRIWDVDAGALLFDVRHEQTATAVTFSPDGTRLCTSSDDRARLWDAATGAGLLELQHDGVVKAVAFSPDSSRVATGSTDGTVRIWQLAGL